MYKVLRVLHSFYSRSSRYKIAFRRLELIISLSVPHQSRKEANLAQAPPVHPGVSCRVRPIYPMRDLLTVPPGQLVRAALKVACSIVDHFVLIAEPCAQSSLLPKILKGFDKSLTFVWLPIFEDGEVRWVHDEGSLPAVMIVFATF